MRFSFVIPFKKKTKFLEENLKALERLKTSKQDFEVILVPDERIELGKTELFLKVFETGAISPGKKRDLGAREARGEILVFIDDDARVKRNFLRNLEKYFRNEEVSAVGGPNITPPEDGFLRKTSGNVFESFFGSGGIAIRYKSSKERRNEEVDDWPSCNFSIRRSVFMEIKGFDTDYWPGEDTIIARKMLLAKKRIVYAPDVVVHHHRREFPIGHAKQVFSYGRMRALFLKKFPENSRKLSYIPPVLFLLYLIALPFSHLLLPAFSFYLSLPLIAYIILDILYSVLAMNPLLILAFPINHAAYGLGFLLGIAKNNA